MGEAAKITIDFLRQEDVDQVLVIEQASFTMPWSRNLFMSEFRNRPVSLSLVALSGNSQAREVIGYLVSWVIADELHILNLAVVPAFRRQGVAERLVLSALRQAYAKGARKAYLEVRESNSAAQKLYADIGFTSAFIRKEYYDMPLEDAVVMTLDEAAFKNLIETTG